MNIRLLYFAQLREELGCAEQVVETEAVSPRALFDQIAAGRELNLDPGHLRVAVNDRMATWDTRLADGDTVVFLTPFGGA